MKGYANSVVFIKQRKNVFRINNNIKLYLKKEKIIILLPKYRYEKFKLNYPEHLKPIKYLLEALRLILILYL